MGGEEYILRCVDEGLCTMGEVKQGLISLADIALLNDYLDVKQENQALYQQAQEVSHGR